MRGTAEVAKGVEETNGLERTLRPGGKIPLQSENLTKVYQVWMEQGVDTIVWGETSRKWHGISEEQGPDVENHKSENAKAVTSKKLRQYQLEVPNTAIN